MQNAQKSASEINCTPGPSGGGAPRLRLCQRLPDGRSVRVAVLLGLIICLNACDLLYTLFARHEGMLHEQNPLAHWFTAMHATVGLISFKILLVLIACRLLWRVRRSRTAPYACWLLVAVYVVLALVWLAWSKQYVIAVRAWPALALR